MANPRLSGRIIIPSAPGKYPCPFHEDSVPSLSVYRDAGGALRWKCHAGCGSGQLDGAVGAASKPADSPRNRPQQEEFLREMRRLGSPPDWALDARKISYAVAIRFDVLFDHQDKKWVFPVRGADGQILALKWHRQIGAPYKQKCGWMRVSDAPCGVSTLYPAPEELNRRKPLVVVPGELKALRVFSAGMQAVSPTAGEGFRWPPRELDRMQGFRCVLIPDQDQAGSRFAGVTRSAFERHGIPLGVAEGF